ncbi:two-component system sensor histidine kinase UhpB [Pseudomonas alcaligenes]|nr:two-component system sensor histidine kinase UhpB [Pseudomonas alcaligenes]
MSTLGRINLLVVLFFAAVALVCTGVLLRQASQDVQREMVAARAVVEYLHEAARRDPKALESALARGLRHVRIHWQGETPLQPRGLDAWLGARLFPPAEQYGEPLQLDDGRRVLISVDPADEMDEVEDSLIQLLVLFGLALGLSLLAIRVAVRRGLRVLDELRAGFDEIARGRLAVRLNQPSLHEARLLAGHFNEMASTLEQVRNDNAELTRALLALQEHERKHLALALHDDIGQYLAGIRAQLLLLRSMTGQAPGAGATLRSLEDNCQRMQDSFRALVRDLYPVVLERLHLGEAIELLTEQWRSAQCVDCQLRLGEDLPVLPTADQAHLYRLLQEALTNIARHADASAVSVRLERRGRRLRLLVGDNGRGAVQPPRPGIGLRSMLERARCLGGDLRLRTRAGGGWLVRLSIPLGEA